jgi:rubrerythrin
VLEEALLAEQFQTLLEKERQAACAYAGLAAKVTDPHLKLKIEQLCRDKEKHIRLAERLLEIVE